MKARTNMAGGAEITITHADYIDLSRYGLIVDGSVVLEPGDDKTLIRAAHLAADEPATDSVDQHTEDEPAPAESTPDPDVEPEDKEQGQ